MSDLPKCTACGLVTFELRAAEAMADAIEAAIKRGPARGGIDARSPMADALLDYRDPAKARMLLCKTCGEPVADHGAAQQCWRGFVCACGVTHERSALGEQTCPRCLTTTNRQTPQKFDASR